MNVTPRACSTHCLTQPKPPRCERLGLAQYVALDVRGPPPMYHITSSTKPYHTQNTTSATRLVTTAGCDQACDDSLVPHDGAVLVTLFPTHLRHTIVSRFLGTCRRSTRKNNVAHRHHRILSRSFDKTACCVIIARWWERKRRNVSLASCRGFRSFGRAVR